jgi:hypothetical protein
MRILLILTLLLITLGQAQSQVLTDGEWIKVAVTKTGVYKIDKAFLDKYAPNFSKTNPNRLQIYGGHATALPQANAAERTKGLVEIPVFLEDQNGQWDNGDFVAFYAQDPHKVFYQDGRFSHELNPYSDHNYYFITVGSAPSKKIEDYHASSTQSPQSSLPYYHYEEIEQTNLLNSGRSWFGPFFNSSYSISLPNKDFDSDFILEYEVLPMGRATQFLTSSSGNILLKQDTLRGSLHNASDNLARYNRVANVYAFQIRNPQTLPTIQLKLSSESIGNVGVYLNYWSVSYNRTLRYYSGEQTIFRPSPDQASSSFRLGDYSSNARVWQVGNVENTKNLKVNTNGILSSSGGTSEIVVFDITHLPNPTFKEKVKNQFLDRVPQVLVVFPEKFRKGAEELIQYKNQNEDLDIYGYSTSEIYNAHSSGKLDPTAIRDFCRDLYTKLQGKLQYLILLGDATFDYKNNAKAAYVDTDLMVPSYQSRESLEPIYSYASDDYFSFLDEHEGEWPEGYSVNNRWFSNREDNHDMDIAVGRIPARSVSELNNYIKKYISYQESIKTADWTNRMAFVADNRDYNMHQRDAEAIEKIALQSYPGLKTEKLYLDDFPMLETNGNYTSPEANKKLHSLVNDGTYLITYIGHGAEDGLTNEKLLTLNDILSFSNPNRLPIWFTATCQFGKFDHPGVQSGAELALLRPDGGAIALLTTTRAVYSSTNQLVNHAFFKNLKNATTLGELFRITKNQSIQGEINRNFSFLGDPTLVLPNWANDIRAEFSYDTLFALDKTLITGEVPAIENGTVLISVVDKPSTKKTLGGFSDSPPFEYVLNSEQIFLGKYEVRNHRFSGDFTLPLQQVKNTGLGRVIFMANSADGSYQEYGYKSPVLVSSEVKNALQDTSPPKLAARLEDIHLVWDISDENGINLSTFDSTSTLTLLLNGKKVENVFNYYSSVNGGTAGRIDLPVGSLSNGLHSATLIVSDIYNNVSRKTFEFNIERSTLKIISSAVFPNPVSDFLNFKVKHSRPGDDLSVKFQLFDTVGRVIKEESFRCNDCSEEVSFGIDFTNFTSSFPKLFYNLVLRSSSEKQDQRLSGSLFFWK